MRVYSRIFNPNQKGNILIMTNAQIEAKKAYLENQKQTMLSHWTNVDETERKEIIMHVNSFINNLECDQKEFWLDFRTQLANQN